MTQNMKLAAGLGLGLVALVLILQKKNLLQGVAAGAVGVVADAGSGLALGIGDAFGVPRTNAEKCAAAKASGSLWDQSLYCPALDFTWSAASAGLQTVNNAAGNAVQSAGELVGIPRTNETECQKALREGRTWDASFACDAGTFISNTFGL